MWGAKQPLLDAAPTRLRFNEDGSTSVVPTADKKKKKPKQKKEEKEETEGCCELEPMQRLWLSLLIITLLWVLVGTMFFKFNQGWDVYEAFFYSINVGLGVGYGQFVIVGDGAKWFTIWYCIAGASLIAGAGALAVQAVLLRQGELDEKASWKRLHPHLHKQNKVHKCSVIWFKTRLLGKYKFRLLSLIFWLLWILFGMAFSMSGNLHCPKMQENGRELSAYARNRRCETPTEALFFVITSMSTAAQVPPRRCSPPANNTLYSCVFGATTRVSGLYECEAPCTADNFALGFTAMYIFIGIPIFGSLMGFIADIYISRFQRRQARMSAATTVSEMTERTFAEMAHINIDMTPRVSLIETDDGATRARSESEAAQDGQDVESQTITRRTVPWYYVVTPTKEKAILWGEFLEYQLNRLDALTDRKLLTGLKRDFRNLDHDSKGYLTMGDITRRKTMARWRKAGNVARVASMLGKPAEGAHQVPKHEARQTAKNGSHSPTRELTQLQIPEIHDQRRTTYF